jgi:hypothetical protein
MDASGSAPSNDGLIPKLLDLLHSFSLVPELGTLLEDPIKLSRTTKEKTKKSFQTILRAKNTAVIRLKHILALKKVPGDTELTSS